MRTLLVPLMVWVVGGLVAWLAGRYHLDANQQELVTSDVIGGIVFIGSMASGLALHWRAWKTKPPNGG